MKTQQSWSRIRRIKRKNEREEEEDLPINKEIKEKYKWTVRGAEMKSVNSNIYQFFM